MMLIVHHLHSFILETLITPSELSSAIQFLTETGQRSTDHGQEFVILSGILGISALIDSIHNAKPPGATEGAVIGPFFSEDTRDVGSNGDSLGSIASEGKGFYMYVHGRVTDTQGNPIAGAIIDTWETDGTGLYDNQYEEAERDGPECRGRLRSDEEGKYAFRGVVPVSYPIYVDGTAGKLLERLGRHPFRPAHLHLQVEAPGYETLITQLYFKDDVYVTSDVIFDVKSSLVSDLKPITDPSLSAKRGFVDPNKVHMELERDLVLATPGEGEAARKKFQEELTRLATKGIGA
ncbi:hypothetical protein D9758_008337 [Tetrapyrgos nigripes]|uniref:Uncharacterized protein n=1 Tax=Tetrapyrgos nigripes TaxID=182062 RepID=A0A8H5LN12_9AGAR|nr:hypothetical protein D9758_008337 [Tetrapyrgos nigripes]